MNKILMRNENIIEPQNQQSCQTSVMVSADDLLKSKNICYPELIVDEKYNTHTLIELMQEWACIYSEKYLNYATIIEIIDESDDLKEFEIRVNRFFKR